MLTFIGDPKDEEKLIALADPDKGIKFRGPVRKARPEDLEKAKLDMSQGIKVQFVVAEAEVDGFKKKVGTQAKLFSEDRLNQELIDSIASIRLAIVEDFWQDTLDFPKPDDAIWWEFWLRGSRGTAVLVHRRFTEITSVVGITQVSKLHVAFPERIVVHAIATPKQISASIDLLAMIGELRKGKELASYYVDMSGSDQTDFLNDVVSKLVLPGDNAPCVCVSRWRSKSTGPSPP